MIRVFIVDDQITCLETVKSVLDLEPNIDVVGMASDGYKAIAEIKVLQPDIVIVDLEMPVIDGFEITKSVCQNNHNIKVLVLSSHDNDDFVTKAINAGAKGYLLKTISLRELVKAIRFACKEDTENILAVNNDFLDRSNRRLNIQHLSDSSVHLIADTTGVNLIDDDFNTSENFNLSSFWIVLKRRYPTAVMGLCGVLLGAFFYLIFAQKTYKAVTLISLEDRQESVSELGKNLSSLPGSNEYSPLAIQARLIKSIPVIDSALENVSREHKGYLIEQISANEIKQNLEVKVIPNTNILEVTFFNPNPSSTTVILNEIINTVIKKNTDSVRTEASSVRQFLEDKVKKQSNELARLETSENLYRKQNGFVDIDNQTKNLVDSLNSLENQEQDLLAQINEQSAKVDNFQQLAQVEDANSAYSRGKISQDRQLENLRTQLTEIEAELAVARSNFTNIHPTVVSLKEKKAEVTNLYQQQVTKILDNTANISPTEFTENRFSNDKDGISQEVFSQLITAQNQLEANKNKLQAIQSAKEKFSDRQNSLPAKVQSLTELVRQREQASESLQFLQRKLEEARIAEAQLISNIQIVEPASTPFSPSSPKPTLVLAVATLVGLILATGIILLLETIDLTLYEGIEVERQLCIPFLASLPKLTDGQLNINHIRLNINHIRLFLQNKQLYEPYRSLLKRLKLSTHKKFKTVVVSSSVPQEGKSVVAAHLGAVAAMLNLKTLIIDAHLDKPEQHIFFQVKSEIGLAEVILCRLCLKQVVKSTEIPNLSILVAGSLTYNSCAIIESPLFENLLQEAAMQYDLIVIDTPSISSNGDAQTLSYYSDGLIMVTRPLHTTTDVLERNVVDLKRNKIPLVGFVINNAGVPQQKFVEEHEDSERKQILLAGLNHKDNSHPNTEETSQP